jgi:hypothetical protein
MGKIEKVFYWFCLVLAIYIVIGFKLIPNLIEDQLLANLDDTLTQKTTVRKVDFNPFTLSAKIHDFKLANEKETTLYFKELNFDFALLRSIFELHASVQNVELVDANINIIEYKDGSFNFNKLLKPTKETKKDEKTEESKGNIKFLVSKIFLNNININYTKQKEGKPYTLNLLGINYTIYNIGTYKNALASNDLKFNIGEHTKVDFSGAFNLTPFKMYGKINIEDLRLQELLYQQKEILNFNINKEAKLDLGINYNIDTSGKLDIKLNSDKFMFSNIDITQNKASIAKLEKLNIQYFDFDLQKQDINLKTIDLNKLLVNLISDKNGINFAKLFKESKDKKKEETETVENVAEVKPSENSKPWNIHLNNLKQTNSNFMFNDKSNNLIIKTNNFNTNISSIKINGSNISLDKFNIMNPKLSFSDKKNRLDINSYKTNISFDKMNMIDGKIDIKNINLKKNKLDFNDKKSSLKIATNGSIISVANVNINGPIIGIKSIVVNAKTLKLKDRSINLAIKNTKANIDKIQMKDSVISINKVVLKTPTLTFKDLKSRLAVNTKNTKVTTNSININGSKISVKKVVLNNPRTKVSDPINKIAIDVNKLDLIVNSFLLNKGTMSIRSSILKNKSLILKDSINQKTINSSNLKININKFVQNKKGLSLRSISIIEPNLSIKDAKSKTDIIAKNLDLSISRLSNGRNGLKIVKTTLSNPNISIILGKSTAKVSKNKSTKIIKKETKKAKKEVSTKLNIGPIIIKNASLNFEDKNLPIPFKTQITKLNGQISKLNTITNTTSKLDIKGHIDKYGITKITGIVNPNNIKILTDINMLFKNISVKNFTPYTGKFIGKELAGGKLDLDLKYNILKSNLDAKNSIVITKLKIGKDVKSKDAISLPLGLAIALLEDTNGVIDLNIPVTGNMDDPKFSIAPIVWKAFVNLITKAITSPFRLLGAIFGFDENEIKSVNFEFGKSDITPLQKETLDKIATILKKRPNLAVKAMASYDKNKDAFALKKIKFDKLVSNEMPNTKDKDYKEQYLELLEDLYSDYGKDIKKFKKRFESKPSKYIGSLETFIIQKQTIKSVQLKKLATSRVTNIRKYLIEVKKINTKQLKNDAKISVKKSSKKTLPIDLKIDKLK